MLTDICPKKIKNGKTTKAQHRQRIFLIYRQICSGCNRPEILEYAIKKKWNVNTSTVDNYIALARKWIYRINDQNAEQGLKDSLAKRSMLFFKCIKSNNFGVAHSVLSDTDKLLGRYPSEKIDLRAQVQNVVTVDFEILKELEGKIVEHRAIEDKNNFNLEKLDLKKSETEKVLEHAPVR